VVVGGNEPAQPPGVCAGGGDGDDIDLQRQIRNCHDIWHAIAGCPTTLTGEAALHGLTAEHQRWNGLRPAPGLPI